MDNRDNMSKLLDMLSKSISDDDLLFASIASELSLEIVKQRISKNYTQADFAKHLGVTQAMVSKWENGDYNFTIKSLISLANRLDMDLQVNLKPHNVAQSALVRTNIDTVTHTKIIQFRKVNQEESWSSTSSQSTNWYTNEDLEPKEM